MTTRWLGGAVLAVLLAVPAIGQDKGKLEWGKKYEGEIGGEKSQTYKLDLPGFSWGSLQECYKTELTLSLKARQSVSITVLVAGTDRKVAVCLLDPRGDTALTNKNAAVRATRLDAEEVNATGEYKLLILSDRTGAFMLRVADVPPKDTEEQLKDKIKRLEKQLDELDLELELLLKKKEKDKEKDNEK